MFLLQVEWSEQHEQELQQELSVLESLDRDVLQEMFPGGFAVEGLEDRADSGQWVLVFDGESRQVQRVALELLV